MTEFTQFVAQHWLLFLALVAIIALIYQTETNAGQRHLFVSPVEATHKMNREKAVVLDIRDNEAYGEGHVVNAINIPFADLDAQSDKLAKFKQKPIIIACFKGISAQKALKQLKKLGFENLAVLQGGMAAWEQAKLPTVKK